MGETELESLHRGRCSPVPKSFMFQGAACCVCRDSGVVTRAESKANHPQTPWYSAKLQLCSRPTGEASWRGGGFCRCSLLLTSSRAAGGSTRSGGTMQPPASRQPGEGTAQSGFTEPTEAKSSVCKQRAEDT